jgi:hypothetical protein
MNATKFDPLEHYEINPQFSDSECAALDYVSELTKSKKVDQIHLRVSMRISMSARFTRSFGSSPVSTCCNLTNIDLNIGWDGLCRIEPRPRGIT